MPPIKLESFSPLLFNGQTINRSIGVTEGIPLVLFHKNGTSLIKDDRSQCIELLKKVDVGPIIEFSNSDWIWCRSDPCNFNCHSLAIGSAVGLTPNDWLEGYASESTLYANPAQILIDLFYQQVDSLTIRTHGFNENDVFVLTDSKTGRLQHSGFMREVAGVPMAISKFGEGPILATSLKLLALVFSASFDEVRWYRLNKDEGFERTGRAASHNLKPKFSGRRDDSRTASLHS